MTPTNSVTGVVTAVDYVGCRPTAGPEHCSVVLSIMPGATSVPMTIRGNTARVVQGFNTIEVSVPPAVLAQTSSQPVPVMHIAPGDVVNVSYATVDNTNVATSLGITMGSPHWGHEAPY